MLAGWLADWLLPSKNEILYILLWRREEAQFGTTVTVLMFWHFFLRLTPSKLLHIINIYIYIYIWQLQAYIHTYIHTAKELNSPYMYQDICYIVPNSIWAIKVSETMTCDEKETTIGRMTSR